MLPSKTDAPCILLETIRCRGLNIRDHLKILVVRVAFSVVVKRYYITIKEGLQ